MNPDTNIVEYRVNLRTEILKRFRLARGEITNYIETTKMLDIVLENLKNDDLLFPWGHRNALKIIHRARELTKVVCQPDNQKVTFKDLRSSMACDLLKKGWLRDEVNARLGHVPSSCEIDRYINFLALDRHKPKQKIYENNLNKIETQLQESRERERLQALRWEDLKEEQEKMKKEFKRIVKEEIAKGTKAKVQQELMDEIRNKFKK